MQHEVNSSTESSAFLDKSFSEIRENKLTQQLKEFLTRKGVDSSLFTTDSKHQTVKSSIEEHSAWLYKHVLPKSLDTHSIVHANRCAFLVPVFINALRLCGNKAALSLKEDKVSLWQITALCHDIAREGDGEDHWDLDSGLMLYYYLTYVLKHDHAESILLAEAIANKDWEPHKSYHQLVLENEQLVWKNNSSVTSKPLANIVIHDCDSLDIARVQHFSVIYLDFCKNYATKNPLAFFILNRIIFEWKSILIAQGDFVKRHDFRIKDQYICEESYSKLLKCIFKQPEDKENINNIDRRDCYKALPLLYANGELLTVDNIKKVTHFLLNLQGKQIPRQPKDRMYHTQQGLYVWQRFANQGLLVRGLPTPSYLREKELKQPENQARLEFDKTRRRKNVPTRTKKPNRCNKHGNVDRSCTWIAEDLNTELFCAQALIGVLNLSQFKLASIDDLKSGTGKKNDISFGKLSDEDKLKSLSDLKEREQMGGIGRNYQERSWQHHEIIADFTDFIGILWTSDPTHYNGFLHGSEYPVHRYSPLILAVFMQKEYELVHNKKLPIFEYSYHGYFKEERINDDILLNVWRIVIQDYLKDQLALGQYAMILNSIENLKLACIYGNNSVQSKTKYAQPADSNYTNELQKRVSAIIQKEKSAIIKKAYEAAKIQLQQNRLTPDAMFFLLAYEVTTSELQQNLEDKFYFHVERLGFYQKIFQLSNEYLSVFNYVIRHFRTLDGQINEHILNNALKKMVDLHGKKPLTSEEEKLVAKYREEIRLKNPSDSLSLIPVSFLKKLLSFLDCRPSWNYKSIHQGYQKGLDLFLESKINNPSFQTLLQSELVEWQIAYQKDALKLINFVERTGLKETISYAIYDLEKILEKNKVLVEKTKINFLSECHGKLSTTELPSQAETLCSIGFLNRNNKEHQRVIRHIFQFFDSTPLESEISPPAVSDLPTASTS